MLVVVHPKHSKLFLHIYFVYFDYIKISFWHGIRFNRQQNYFYHICYLDFDRDYIFIKFHHSFAYILHELRNILQSLCRKWYDHLWLSYQRIWESFRVACI